MGFSGSVLLNTTFSDSISTDFTDWLFQTRTSSQTRPPRTLSSRSRSSGFDLLELGHHRPDLLGPFSHTKLKALTMSRMPCSYHSPVLFQFFSLFAILIS